MSDPITKPSETGATPTPDKFVPKEDYEKLAGSVKELESKLDDAKLSLLDPDYIDFLESKKGKQVEKAVKKELTEADTKNMTSQQILDLATDRAKEALMQEVLPKYEEALKKQGSTIQDILAYIELGECEKKYKDFNDYRDDVRKVLENSQTRLTIEQAYKQAKLDKLDADGKLTPKDEKATKPTQSEKPTSTVPGDTLGKGAFKSKAEAAEDAWDRIVGSGKDTL
jgi:hypothetical protein